MNETKNKINARLIFNGLAILFFVFMLLTILLPIIFAPNDHERPQSKCRIEVESIGTALESYQSAYSAFPSGNSIEITKALLGENPRKIKFLNLS